MLVRRFASASLLFFSAVLVAQTSQPKTASTGPKGVDGAPSTHNSELPVRRVVLYKNGVGYFEHAGRVNGNQAVTIDFTSSQLNDVLQSLTALDLGGGRITGVGYNSTTPLDQQLKNIPLGLDDNPSTEEVYGALRGAHVEVSGVGAATVSGRVVNYETRSQKTAAGDTVEHPYLTMASDAGAVRTFELTGTTSVRIIDGGLRRDLDEYLGLLASTQSQQVRHLTLQAQGTGARDIKVSYISEVPVWKSTYRIVFPDNGKSSGPASGAETAILQGWAVVDNTVGSDWSNVQLSLVAGAPQSFIEPLSQPIYTQRPEVPVPEAANLAPVTHEGALDAPGPPPPPASASETVTVNGAPLETQQAAHGFLQMRKAAPGTGGGYGGGTYRAGAGGVMGGVLGALGTGPLVQDETASANSAKFDDYFEYTLAQPVTIHKNESALVPVLQTNVEADRVTLYNAANPVPLRALWLTNSGNLTLDRGSFSIFENGEFAGEGLMDPIHAGEKRLLSYAVDQAVHVSTEGHLYSTHLRHITVHDGYLTERNEEVREVTYVVHNAAADARNVIVEHPAQDGWKLTSEVKPVETSASLYRFSVATQAGETVRLHVGEAHTGALRYQLTAVQDSQLQIIMNGSGNRAAVEKALAPVLAARAKVHDLDTQIAAKQTALDQLAEDQKRLHDNLAGLKDSAEERALARRYAGEMNTDEDQLQSLKKEQADLEQQRKTAQLALDEAIRQLDVDEDV
ncbi:MAG TPA: hypothetical protein VHZ25_12415 [Acidobacteriaceae bacterium]|jgi:hypothetical protein|nr:hypothetical protein [Acidobacteriaceae bacterium]